MKNNFLVVAIATMIAVSSSYAFGGQNNDNKNRMGQQQNMMGQQQHRTGKQQHRMGQQHNMMGKKGRWQRGSANELNMRKLMLAISSMDLSDKQWNNIKKTMIEIKVKRINSSYKNQKERYIDENGNFDKDMFISRKTEFSNKRIESQANSIEKILNILTDEQKKRLSTKLSQNRTQK